MLASQPWRHSKTSMQSYNYYIRRGTENTHFAVSARIGILGNCSTETFSKVLKGFYVENGMQVDLIEASYDTINSELLDPDSLFFSKNLDFILLYFSPLKIRDLFFRSETKTSVADECIAALRQCVDILKDRKINVLLTSIPTNLESCFGNASALFNTSLIYQLQKFNNSLKETVRSYSNCFLLDIEHLANNVGLVNFHSEKLWSMGKMPCHPKFFPTISEEIYRIQKALKGSSKKVIVLDLDNTLWGGVIGDDGVTGISLGNSVIGEAYKAFQYYLKSLKEKGYLLTVCSKNEYEVAIEPFRKHDEMILKENDITLFMANWEPKSTNISEMAQILNLNLDSFVFIDDNPFERNEVRSALPNVFVPEMPTDPAEYISALDQSKFLENVVYTENDSKRSDQYKTEALRYAARSSANQLDDYLSGLNMVSRVERINESNIERAFQLILRSNQFNLRTQRVSKSELEEYSKRKDYITFCFHLSDKYGDLGLISVLILKVIEEQMFIEEFVMSCRVLKRGMEAFIMNQVSKLTSELGLVNIVGEYIPTQKNKIVQYLYPDLGFQQVDSKENLYQLKADNFDIGKNFIRDFA